MDKQQNRYKKDVPADDMPKSPAAPELKLCQFSNGPLVIPTDIRKHFLNCPIYGPEWREIIVKFDKDWGVAVQPDPARHRPSLKEVELRMEALHLRPVAKSKRR